jgi:hypothetical protein
LAIWIAESRGIALFGKRAPSQRYEEIPVDRVKQLQMQGGAKELIDLIMIIVGAFTDSEGERVLIWLE